MTSLKTSTTSKAAMAIVVAAISITIFAPSAYAAGPDRTGRDGREMQANRQGGMMGGRGGQLLALGCGPNAAERIETGLVRLGYRVDAIAEQKTLLDSLKTASLAAQAELATVCAEVLPARTAADAAAPADAPAADAATRPDLLTRLQSRIKLEEARLAAMTDVLPQFEAFYNSLTAEQKSALEPKGDRDGRGPGRDRDRGHDGRPHDNRDN